MRVDTVEKPSRNALMENSMHSYPVGETSRILSTSDFTVRRLIRSKQLRAVRIGGQWRILAEDLHAFLEGCANRLREPDTGSDRLYECHSSASSSPPAR